MSNQQTTFSLAGANLAQGESSDWQIVNVEDGLIEVYGTFGGAAVEFDMSGDPLGDADGLGRDPNDVVPVNFASAKDDTGITVSVTVERSDIPVAPLPDDFRMRARVVGGDGTTDLLVRITH